MRIVTYFDDYSWSQYAQSWRKPSVKVLDPIVLYPESLKDDAKKEIVDSFVSTNVCSTQFFELCKFVSSLVDKDDYYALISPKIAPPSNLVVSKDALCMLSGDVSTGLKVDTSRSITNLSNRVDVIKTLDEISSKEGGLLDPSLIVGTKDFWIAFSGFQSYLSKSNYIFQDEVKYPDLVLNLFYSSSASFSIEVQK